MNSVAAREQAWCAAALAGQGPSPAWRAWAYREPALVLGPSQVGQGLDEPRCERLTRRSGGGAVLVGPWMLGLSVRLPASHALARAGLLPAYTWLGELLREALRPWCPRASVLDAPRARDLQREGASPRFAWACFGGVSPGELVLGRRKLAGLSQARSAHAVLLSAGVLLYPPGIAAWRMLCDECGRPREHAGALARGCVALASRRDAARVRQELCRDLRLRLGAELSPLRRGSTRLDPRPARATSLI